MKSKTNELEHLRDHCARLKKSNDAELNIWTKKWELAKEEVKRMQKTNMFSEASVIAQQKMNVVKGNLIEVDTQLNNLSNELLSLRNVKTNQHGELEK